MPNPVPRIAPAEHRSLVALVALVLLVGLGLVSGCSCDDDERRPARRSAPIPAPASAGSSGSASTPEPERDAPTAAAAGDETIRAARTVPIAPPTLAVVGGECRVASETLLAENEQPARGIAVAYAGAMGVAAWPVAPDRVAVQRLDASGAASGAIVEHAIDQARGIHALEAAGERFVLMTRGACAHPPSPSLLHCSAYLGLEASLAPSGPPRVIAHANQARAAARLAIGGSVYLALAMETGVDAAGLSAPTFDIEVLRLSFGASGALELAHSAVAEPGEYGDETVTATLAPCADGISACGAMCADGSNRCVPIGIGSRMFRNPVAGSEPRSARCDADGCDVVFRRGPTVRGKHIDPEGESTTIDVAAPATDSVVTGHVESGRFTRRDATGAVVGEPIELASRDARTSVTWTGTHFLAASASRRGRTTRYVVSSIACVPPQSP